MAFFLSAAEAGEALHEGDAVGDLVPVECLYRWFEERA